jgi:hypothetical protein
VRVGAEFPHLLASAAPHEAAGHRRSGEDEPWIAQKHKVSICYRRESGADLHCLDS